MKQDDFCRQLREQTPDVSERFHRRVEDFLSEKAAQEAAPQTRNTTRSAAPKGRRVFVFALAAVLLLGTVAIAATHWRVFDIFHLLLGSQPPTADSVMQAKLHQETVNGVEITVREAGYDGRTLFLQYSYRLPEATGPMGEMGRDGIRMLCEEDIALLISHNVGWWVDAFWINGQQMEMAGGSGGEDRGSEVPGEIIHTEYWRLDNIGVELTGKVEIAMPIGERQTAEYRSSLYDRATGEYRLPDRGVVTFTFDAGDALSRVVRETPNIATITPDVTVRVTEAAFTPLMTYITLAMEPDPESLAAYKEANGDGWYDADGTLLWEYTGQDVYSDWIMALRLVDGTGRQLFPEHTGCTGCGDDWAEFIYPYMDPAALPHELWLAPLEGGMADMTCAVRVK